MPEINIDIDIDKEVDIGEITIPPSEAKNKRRYLGYITEQIVGKILLSKYSAVVKIGEYSEDRVFKINSTEIYKELFRNKLNEEEEEARHHLLAYIKEKKYGLPDFIVFKGKNISFVEVKSGTSTLSKKQRQVKKELEKKGYEYVAIKLKRNRGILYDDKNTWVTRKESQEVMPNQEKE